jgi:hypothetical protein
VLKYAAIFGYEPKAWQLACVRELESSGLARLTCVVSDNDSTSRFSSRPSAYERFCATLKLPSQADCALADVCAQGGDDLTRVVLSPSDSPEVCRTRIRSLDLDFFLLFSNERLGRVFQPEAKYGVWYFAHSDLARFSSAAPCFWEIYHNHNVTGALLLKLDRSDSAGIVLKSGYLPTQDASFERSVETVFSLLPRWPARVCWDIAHGAASYLQDKPIPHAPARHGNPTAAQIAGLKMLEAKNRVRDYLRETFYPVEWNVGRVKETPSDFIGRDVRADVTYLYPRRNGRFVADPCVFTRGSQTYVFCEEYQYENSRGSIIGSELSANGASSPQLAIVEPYHLSYPQVFELNGEVFCVPESNVAMKTFLYRAIEFPYRWQRVHTLLEGFGAADCTIVQFNKKWWLFCTSSEMLRRGHNAVLYIWHADDLFGTWTPHLRNPVKIDARSARPAGPLFTYQSRLFRPAQDCSREYGELIRINRIDVLTETDFKETVVGAIRSPAGAFGIHTISAAGEWCVVDVGRYVFRADGFVTALKDATRWAALGLGVRPEKLRSVARRFKKNNEAASL